MTFSPPEEEEKKKTACGSRLSAPRTRSCATQLTNLPNQACGCVPGQISTDPNNPLSHADQCEEGCVWWWLWGGGEE